MKISKNFILIFSLVTVSLTSFLTAEMGRADVQMDSYEAAILQSEREVESSRQQVESHIISVFNTESLRVEAEVLRASRNAESEVISSTIRTTALYEANIAAATHKAEDEVIASTKVTEEAIRAATQRYEFRLIP